MNIYLWLLPVFILGLYAQVKLQSTYSKYSRVRTQTGLTGRAAARFILDSHGLFGVRIEPTRGTLTDHYDPRTNTVRLSEGVYNSPTITAVGIAAHECGHAIQHATDYKPLKFRNAIIPITSAGSQLAIPLLLFGLLFQIESLIYIGVFGYAFMALFQLITLPIEYNASKRAMQVIEGSNLLVGNEVEGARQTLKAAALTYVAALVSALAQLLGLVSILGGNRKDD